MFSLLRASWRLAFSGSIAFAVWALRAQAPLPPLGQEYLLAGSFPGDQVFSQVALGPSGGYVVWHDNFIDGNGSGIGARRLDGNSAGVLGAFRVNGTVAGDQEYPRMALFSDRSAVIVWQGGRTGFPKIYARFLAADGTFATGEILVNSFARGRQLYPQVVALSDNSAVVVWTGFDQDGSYAGVFGQRLTGKGEKLGGEFMVNTTTLLSQRTPSIAALPDGTFVVVWVSEKENRVGTPVPGQEGVATTGPGALAQPYDVSVFARLFDSNGPASEEIKVNTSSYVCANPVVSAGTAGDFAVAWSSHVGRVEVAGVVNARGWDVRARAFGAGGAPVSEEAELNERAFGDQFLPSIAAIGGEHLVAWVSLGQDGSREGIYARLVSDTGVPRGTEFKVNATTAGSQKLPAVASDGAGRCLIVWSGARGGAASYDLFAQRYSLSQQLRAPSKPMVLALSSSRLSVTWPALADLGAVSYRVYVDGATAPLTVTDHFTTLGQLAAGSTHTFQMAYVLRTGEQSPLSETASGTTWGEDGDFDGLPDDWQASHWGPEERPWPAANIDSDGDRATNLQEFLAGTDPRDPNSILRLTWRATEMGTRLHWNTEKGCVYQVQTSSDLKRWEAFGSPRFAAGTTDSIPANREQGRAMYRVIRVR